VARAVRWISNVARWLNVDRKVVARKRVVLRDVVLKAVALAIVVPKHVVRRIASRKGAARMLAVLRDVDRKLAARWVVDRKTGSRKCVVQKVVAPTYVVRIPIASRKPVRRVTVARVAKLKGIASLKVARATRHVSVSRMPARAMANVANRAGAIKHRKSSSRNRSSRRSSVKRIGRSTSTASSI